MLVTLLARASTFSVPPPIVVPPPPPVQDNAALFAEIDRLRARLRPPEENATPSRNLFAFRREVAVSARLKNVPVPVETTAVAAFEAAAPSAPLSLIGLADEAGPSGLRRTAILSGSGGLHFVEVDAVVAGYRVVAIRDDAVELAAVDEAGARGLIVLTFK